MPLIDAALVALGGVLGTLARHALSILALPISRVLPWGTILINASGSFLIGAFGTLTLAGGRFPAPEPVRLLVMVGFCGGYTTFSSFSLQTLDLLRQGSAGRAGVNAALSVALGVGSVAAGHLAAAHWNGHATRIAQAAIEREGGRGG